MPKGFERATSDIKKLRLIVRVGGLEKEGKTHFALTAPGSIGMQAMDRGTEGVVEKFADLKDIFVKGYRDMPAKTPEDHQARWDAFVTDYKMLLKDPIIRTIVWDTDTEVWEMIRLAHFGKLTQIKSHHYGPVNAELRGLIDMAFTSDTNLIMAARYKKQYIKKNPHSDDSVWNGKFDAAGFTEVASIVQVNLRTKLVRDGDGEQIPTIEVINCRQNMQMNGEVFEGEMANFPWIAANIIEGTSPGDWE